MMTELMNGLKISSLTWRSAPGRLKEGEVGRRKNQANCLVWFSDARKHEETRKEREDVELWRFDVLANDHVTLLYKQAHGSAIFTGGRILGC